MSIFNRAKKKKIIPGQTQGPLVAQGGFINADKRIARSSANTDATKMRTEKASKEKEELELRIARGKAERDMTELELFMRVLDRYKINNYEEVNKACKDYVKAAFEFREGDPRMNEAEDRLYAVLENKKNAEKIVKD